MKDRLADKLTPPTSDTAEKLYLTEEQLKQFVAVCEKQKLLWKLYMMVSLETGARPEEVLGIWWPVINEKTREIKIMRTLQYVDKKLIEGEPKNAASYRTVQVSKAVIDLLLAWKKKQLEYHIKLGAAWINTEYVFTTECGIPMLPTTCSTKAKKLFNEAKIEGVNLYTLRHTSVTRMLASGIPVVNVAAYHGHSSAKMTLDVYGHAAEDYAKNCSAVMDFTQFKSN